MLGLIGHRPGTIPWHSNDFDCNVSSILGSSIHCLVVSFPAVSDVARHVYVDLDAD